MNRDELLNAIVAACPGRDDVVYLERRGTEYGWRIELGGGAEVDPNPSTGPGPDVWMSFSASWPVDDSARLQAFFDDVMAELESMADHADRCRWPIDDPWPHFH
jgi:hypothetical protein